ncbi:hypothetical protein ACHAXR_011081 [Thalassiosira sp. AJA248-18]
MQQQLAKVFNLRFNFFVLIVIAVSSTYHHQSLIGQDQEMKRRVEIVAEASRTMPMPDATTEGSNDDLSLPCTLQSRPTPMILMSLGRSGTASIYQTLSKLSGGGNEVPRIIEYTGGSTSKSREFFSKHIPNDDVNGDWLIKFICREQRHYPDAGIVGFKWKPYETIFSEEKAKQGLELLAKLARMQGPQIKVIRSRRNLLDVMISRHKHSLSKKDHGTEGKISAHCQKDDRECLKQHLKAGTGISLPTRRLVSQLQQLYDMEGRVDKLLERMHVPTISVSFEKLFLAGSDSEWKRIFQFLGVGPTENLTAAEVEKAGHAATSMPLHNVTLSNYEEVRNTLLGAPNFASLLH